MFFTPIANTNSFYISYSTKAIAEEHGVEVTLAKEGVQSFTVNYLKPNTVYYFKIRGQNGCATGEWSKVMKVITRPEGSANTKSFYEYATAKTNFVDTVAIKNKGTISTIKENDLPKVTPEITPSINQVYSQPITPTKTPVPEPSKKRCFLWWCF